jgi:DNA repair protein RecO (recombination protein O)
MPPKVRTDQALILRRFHYGESSLVLQVLARGRGRVHLIARGAYRPKSRYYAALDLFDTLELEWSESRGGELQNLREARIERRRARIATDLERFRAATTALELVSLAAREDQPGEELFALLEELLDDLAALAAGAGPDRSLARFELRLLGQLGLSPALLACAACGREAPAAGGETTEAGEVPRAAFSAGAGGRLCAPCAAAARASGRRVGTMPLAVLEAAADLIEPGAGRGATMSPSTSPDVGEDPDPHGAERVRDLVARFLEYHLESRPRSYRNFLAVPNRNRPASRSGPAPRSGSTPRSERPT